MKMECNKNYITPQVRLIETWTEGVFCIGSIHGGAGDIPPGAKLEFEQEYEEDYQEDYGW